MVFGSSYPLAVVIKGVDKLSKPLGKAGGALGRFGAKAVGVGTGMTASLTAAAIGASVSIVKTAADYETSMLRVKALTTPTAEEFAKLESEARRMGATTAFSAKQAAEAQGFLAQAGFNVAAIYEALPGTLDLAASGLLELSVAADLGSNVLTGYAMQTDQYGRVVDRLAGVQAKANTNVEQAAEAMKLAGPVAAGMNQTFEDSVAIVGAMGNAGFQGTLAGTAFRGMLVGLTEITPKVAKHLTDLKITPDDFRDSTGALRSMIDVVELLGDRGASAEQIMAIFGRRAGPPMVALVSQGADAIRELRGEIEGVRAAEVAAIQMSGAAGQALTLKSAFEELQLAIADSGLLGDFGRLVGWATAWIRGMSAAEPKTLRMITVVAGLTAVLGPAIVAGGALLAGLGGLVTVGGVVIPVLKSIGAVLFKTVIPAIWAWTAALLSNPIGLVTVAVVALIAAGIALWKNWDRVVGFLVGLWDGLKDAILASVDWIMIGVRKLFDLMPDWFVSLLRRAPGGAIFSFVDASNGGASDGIVGGPGAGGPVGPLSTGATGSSRARVEVDFSNLPEGTRVTSGGDADLDLSAGGILLPG